jgi:hypothetical protein
LNAPVYLEGTEKYGVPLDIHLKRKAVVIRRAAHWKITMHTSVNKTAALAALMLVAACSETQEIFRPFDVDKTSVSADAKQRVILSATRGTNGDSRRIVCAEPSPDAVSAIAASFGANLAASVPISTGGQVVKPEVQLAFQRAIAEQVAYIGVRNSTIQLLRDGLYRACEAYLNGAVGDFGYALILSNYGRLMVGLLVAEGITRPSFTGPSVLTSQANATGGAAPQQGNSSAQGGGTPGSAQDSGSMSDGDLVEVVNMVRRLADPHADPGPATAADVALACLIWAEKSPLRGPKGGQDDLIANVCGQVLAILPGAVEGILAPRPEDSPAILASVR